ncbi:MAG TPA: hypothetical protein VGI83_03280, partial [Gemmatimonadales bacterium]
MIRPTRFTVTLLALAAMAGCNDAVSPGSSGAVDGLWDWTGHYNDAQSSLNCSDTGSFVFSQKDTAFSGTVEYVGTCTGTGANGPVRVYDSVLRGVVKGTAINFSLFSISGGLQLCSDSGVLVTGAVPSLSGVASCGSATLTWSAVKGAPVASVSVSPDSGHTVVGGVVPYDMTLTNQAGTRVFGRAVTWASDLTSVATVVPVGATALATAVGAGTATISATVEGHTGTGVLVVPAPAALSHVSAGDARTCALSADGTASCWGAGFAGAGLAAVPTPLGGGRHFSTVSVGGEFACGLASGVAYCWGANESGQLGNGGTTASATPVAVSGAQNFSALATGYRYTCGITAVGSAYCWGLNDAGQLGTASTSASLTPVPVSGGVSFTAISARLHHTCGLTSSGDIYCWGDNTFGQLGDNTTTQRDLPTRVTGTQTYTAVSTGVSATCAIATGGAAYCWGTNGFIGANSPPEVHVPTAVAGGKVFTAISVGDDHQCGL